VTTRGSRGRIIPALKSLEQASSIVDSLTNTPEGSEVGEESILEYDKTIVALKDDVEDALKVPMGLDQ
jgi:hypothetical protein